MVARDVPVADSFELRVQLGSLVRELGPNWSAALALSDVIAQTILRSTPRRLWPGELYFDVVNSLFPQCWTWKPPLNGKEISKEFNVKGRGIGEIVALLQRWMLGVTQQQRTVVNAIEYVRAHRND